MAASVYVETTVPSAYVTTRTDPGSLHRRNVTRQWWHDQLPLYDVWVSDNVLLELKKGDWPGQSEAIDLIDPLPRLPIEAEVMAVATRYIEQRLTPADLFGEIVPSVVDFERPSHRVLPRYAAVDA